jgi:hypothetical protein
MGVVASCVLLLAPLQNSASKLFHRLCPKKAGRSANPLGRIVGFPEKRYNGPRLKGNDSGNSCSEWQFVLRQFVLRRD